ncbi:hypothetical protein FS842_007211 [Serendipita sp. 407]|nr:hypothetical protein FS842_007211 [Serendipita sp. 407]
MLTIFDAGSYAPELEQLSMQQLPSSESTLQSLQSGVQGQGTPYTQRRGVSIGTAPNYGCFSPFETDSVHSSFSMRWLIEESSVAMPSQNHPFTPLYHPSSLNTMSPALSNVGSQISLASVVGIGAESDLLASRAMASCEAIYQSRPSVKNMMVSHDHSDLTKYSQPQRTHEGHMKGRDDRPLSTLSDLPQASTLEPSSQASAHIVKSGNRYICGICFKTHTRPSRAVACENDHLGYQPFECDSTCGDSTW